MNSAPQQTAPRKPNPAETSPQTRRCGIGAPMVSSFSLAFGARCARTAKIAALDVLATNSSLYLRQPFGPTGGTRQGYAPLHGRHGGGRARDVAHVAEAHAAAEEGHQRDEAGEPDERAAGVEPDGGPAQDPPRCVAAVDVPGEREHGEGAAEELEADLAGRVLVVEGGPPVGDFGDGQRGEDGEGRGGP